MSLFLALCLLSAPVWAVTAGELVKHFEESQKLVNSSMVSFAVQKKASDQRIADMFDFVSDKSYEYEGMLINGAAFPGSKGAMGNLLTAIGDGVFAVIHKLATDDHKNLFKPTWIGYHSPGDKKVSNWFCLIMGNHTRTYLTRVDNRSKLDEVGADPLQMNFLNKDLFSFDVAKDLGSKAILRIVPKSEKSGANFKQALVEMSKIEISGVSAWYVSKISGEMNNGSTGETEFGKIHVAAAPAGAYIAWSADNKPVGNVPVWGIGSALQQKIQPDQKLFVFATEIKTTTTQKGKGGDDYEITLQTQIQRLFLNPSLDLIAQYITDKRMGTLVKLATKVANSH